MPRAAQSLHSLNLHPGLLGNKPDIAWIGQGRGSAGEGSLQLPFEIPEGECLSVEHAQDVTASEQQWSLPEAGEGSAVAPVVFEGNPGALWGLRSKSTHPAQGGSTLTHTPLSGAPPPRAFMSHTRVSLYEFWGDMNIRSKQGLPEASGQRST